MKKFLFSITLSLVIFFNLIAQQNHFIYIQADNKQPFYVKLNDKVYSSSATGYIILSKLIENNYNLTIGFPKNEWAEQKLSLAVQKNDLGYLLKNFDEKGWGLVDMNTFQILYANSPTSTSNPTNNVAKANSINVKTIEENKEKPKPIETVASNKTDAKIEEVKEKPKEIDKEESIPIKKEDIATKDIITKLFTSKSSSNIEMVYVVKNNIMLDTVRITIPIDEQKKQDIQLAQSEEIKSKIETLIPKPLEKPIEEQPKQLEAKDPIAETNVVKNVSKNNCKQIANEEDYKKLRKKMASVESDNEMIYKATSTFQKQCFTTEQIKTLSFLFLNDEGKYKFLDAAYPYITDAQNFSKLASLLSDEYYIKRFNAMLKN